MKLLFQNGVSLVRFEFAESNLECEISILL